jgi:hypothetical protein
MCNDVKLQFIGVLCPMVKVGIAVGIVTRRWVGRPKNRAPFAAGSKTFISSITKTRLALGFWRNGHRVLTLRSKWASLHLQSRSRMWSYTSKPPYVFTAWYFIIRYLLISVRWRTQKSWRVGLLCTWHVKGTVSVLLRQPIRHRCRRIQLPPRPPPPPHPPTTHTPKHKSKKHLNI